MADRSGERACDPTITGRSANDAATGESAVVVVEAVWIAAAAAVLAGLVAVWLCNGVGLADVARYVGYLAAFAALPGIMLAAVLDRRPLGLAHVCVGIPLGLLQTMIALVVFAAAGLRGVAPWAPLACAALAGLALARRRPRPGLAVRTSLRPEALLVAAVALVSVLLMASRDFAPAPLPDHIGAGASYYVDLPWHIGNVAMLKQHWPPQDLRAAQEPLKYSIGDYLQAAQTSLATGVRPATIVLRLDPAVQLALIALELFWAGRVLGRRARTGVIAAFLTLLVGDVSSLHGATDSLYSNFELTDMFLSPTYLIGFVFFVPLLGVAVEWLRQGGRFGTRLTAPLGLLMLGAALSKTVTVAIMIATGLALASPDALFRRRFFRPGFGLAALAGLAYLALFPLVHRHGGETALRVNALASVRDSGAWKVFRDGSLDVAPHHVIPALLVVLGAAPVLLIGFAGLLVRRRTPFDTAERMLVLSVIISGWIVVVFADGYGGQFRFWNYGYVALALLASLGIDALLAGRRGWTGRLMLTAATSLSLIGIASTIFQAGPGARRTIATVIPGVPGPFHTGQPPRPELTRSILRGLDWLRAHSNANDVVAVNNQSTLAAPGEHRYFYYSAFSERQILLEGYAYTPGFGQLRTAASDEELEHRLSLVASIYWLGSAAAIEEARRRYGVDYLLVDHRDDLPYRLFPPSVTRLVFSDGELEIYRVAAPSGAET